MKSIVELMYSCTDRMFNYLQNKDLNQLLQSLLNIEDYCAKTYGGDKKLWFKFGGDDTLVTTIEDIKKDLSLPTNHPNHKLMVEKLELVSMDIEPDNALLVFYS